MSFSGKPSLENIDPTANDGFWPALAMADLVSKYRIPSEYDTPVIETGLKLGMIKVNEELERVKVLVSVSHATFTDYTSSDGMPSDQGEFLNELYAAAVYCRAKAFLVQQFNSMRKTPNTTGENDEIQNTESHWLNECQYCVSRLLALHFPDEDFARTADLLAELI
jgi:hypothetical protein